MNPNLKKIIAVLLIMSFSMLFSFISSADVQVPAKIRVGLLYNETATRSSSATASFTVSANAGLQVGYAAGDTFTVLYEEPTANPLTIQKDTTFHIQIGANYNTYDEAFIQIQTLKLLGINVYPAFVDAWQVWTGSYADLNTATNDLNTNLTPKLPGVLCTVIQPAANQIGTLSAAGDVLMMFGSDTSRFQIHPKAENNPYLLKINGKSCYRGDLEVRRYASSDMTVINILPMDWYLYGVVPYEIGGSAPFEAQKAQAVAARTYAMGRMGNHANLGFDLCPSEYDQVYKGYNGESATSNRAVDETSGKKVLYQGKLAQTFFYSSSGGMTEDVKNVWGSSYPYLVSVEDKYESGKTWNYNWTDSKTASQIKSILQGKNKDIGDILSVTITKTAPSGRVTELLITGTKDSKPYTLDSCRTIFSLSSQWYIITTNADTTIMDCTGSTTKTQMGSRTVMTANGLQTIQTSSVKVAGADGAVNTIQAIPTNYTFTGKGWGHAVGMSQDGAMGMARAGFTYDQILKHYFTGVTVE